ncbi:beta-N-acetylglucosaminidase [hydrothermal vent metagenome]|uniref:Beta-N-acetylglucosaminidase n=1 Tax=hydrothermal vent metagenome TaxID=652676 RepID=A0A3B1C9X1_9ZZZZ
MTDQFTTFRKNANESDIAGQLMIIGFNGTRYTSSIGSWFKKLKPGGVILFSRNIENSEQTKTLISDLKKLGEDITSLPLFVCIDQEGGRVARLSNDMPKFPTAKELGNDGSTEQVDQVYGAIGKTIKELGFNVDFAPVLDLDTNSENPIIGDRAFSCDANKVAKLGQTAIAALRREGILACGKHFPGHGDTSLDSHLTLPEDNRPLERFNDHELIPFEAAINEKVDFIMTAHVMYPSIDAEFPATLSKKIITDILRNKMGYNGIIASDDMDMKAIADRWSDGEAIELAVRAGVDVTLVCHESERLVTAYKAIRRIIVGGGFPDGSHETSLERILHAKSNIKF